MDQTPSLLHSLEVALANLPPLPQSTAYIYRVPSELRNGNEHHYTPTTVSIGPFHAANPSLDVADGEQLKCRALNHLLYRTQTTLPNLFQLLKGMEEEARLCYAETVDLSSDEFVEMMLLDGCLILALHTSDYRIPADRARGLLLQNIQQDLLLFENQLPLFVLEGLFTQLYQDFSEWYNMIFRKHALNFFRPILPTPFILTQHLKESTTPTPTPRHLLELVLLTFFPPQTTAPTRTISDFKKKNISELVRYRIKPVPRECNLAKIKFSFKGLLKIPPLYIQESTTSLFKNLLALEMCFGAQTKSCFLSYLSFMDVLVDSDKDVELLIRGGVLKTKLNDKQAFVSLLSDLASSMSFYNDEYFTFVYQDLEKYLAKSSSRLGSFMPILNIANTFLILWCTIIQTLYAIMYSSRNNLN